MREEAFLEDQSQNNWQEKHLRRKQRGPSLDTADEPVEARTPYQYEPRSHQLGRGRSSKGNGRYYLILLVVSALAALSFYSFPLVARSASGVASANLYSGFAMTHGLMAYNDFFGSAGPLFYLLNQLGNLGGSTWLLWLLEILILFVSGCLAFSILREYRVSKRVAGLVADFTVLSIAGISLGGDAAAEFALPFVFYGLYVLNRYFVDVNAHKDELFLLYGAAGALASLIYPLFLLFWLVSFVALLVRNIRQKILGRGVYQLLAGLFGFLLVYAVMGYVTLTSQIFFPAIDQAVLLPFSHLHFGGATWEHFGLSLVLLLLFGGVAGWLSGLRDLRSGDHRAWTALLLIFSVLLLFLAALSNAFSPTDALVALPFVFFYVGVRLDRLTGGASGYRPGELLSTFLLKSWLLPALGVFFLIGFPMVQGMVNQASNADERAVATYVRAHTRASDGIIVAADDEGINLLSRRVSKLALVPGHYAKDYQDTFDTRVENARAKIVVTQAGKALPASLKRTLKADYSPVRTSISRYKVYELKK